MELNIRITDDSTPHQLTVIAKMLNELAGNTAQCPGTCAGVKLEADGRLENVKLDHVSIGYQAEFVPNATAQAQDEIPETGYPLNVLIGNEPLTGYAPDTGIVTAEHTVTEAANLSARATSCSNCGFYDCRCEEFDAAAEEAAREELDTAAIFGGNAGAGKHPAEDLDTSAIFGGASNPAPALSTAAVTPSTTAQIAPPPVTCPPVPGAPTNAASADSTGANVPTAAGTTNHAGVELDKAGLPWDARIHARTKAKVADGTWRMKRGVAPEVVNSVVAELKAAQGAPAAPASVATPPTTPPAVPGVPGAPAAPQLGPFPQLMRDLTPFICSDANPNNRISQSGLRQHAAALGLINQSTNEGEVAMLMHRTDLIQAFRDRINMHLAQWGESLGA